MAFMIPVVKNDWDIYKSNKPRKISESNSTTSSTPPTSRTRKTSESRFDSSHSTASRQRSFPKYHSVPDRISSASNFRTRASSECSPNRSKVVLQAEKVDLKRSQSWLSKLKNFVKHKSEDERTKS